MGEDAKTKKPIYKKWWFWLIIIVVVGVVSSGKKDATTSSTPSEQMLNGKSGEPKSVEPVKETGPKVGDIVTFDDSKWVVLSVKNAGHELTSTNEFAKPMKTEGNFVVIKYKVTNTSGKEEVLADVPKLYDAQGSEYQETNVMGMSLYLGDDANGIQFQKLPNNISKTFYAVFEVSSVKGLKYQVRSLSAFGDKRLVDLGL
ncbi:MAG: hypothetical protein JST20_10680 [Bacteroidetes bacterium]|nr:hypothetical protein [Bacteroidota bacterium]